MATRKRNDGGRAREVAGTNVTPAAGPPKVKGQEISSAILERSPATSGSLAIAGILKSLGGVSGAGAGGLPAAAALPQVFPCKAGDVLTCTYHVNSIVAVLDLFWAPDENADGQPDRLELLAHSETSNVEGSTPALPLGWSFLIWDFAPANQNPWTAQLSLSINGGPPKIFQELSGDESSHHQAGLLVWAAP
jgi:hypothetical protein